MKTYQPILSPISSFADKPSLHALVMSDCANAVANLTQGNAKTREKTLKLTSSHIRDMQQYMAVSFCCAPLNISDVGAKHQSNLTIYRLFCRSGRFSIGFLSRSESRSLLQLPQFSYLKNRSGKGIRENL